MISVSVVVWVTPPPLAVMVIVWVPALAAVPTLISIPACPAPGAGMVLGLNVTWIPLPSPDAVNEIAELKPPETVVVIFDRPGTAPRVTVSVLGASVTVNVPDEVPASESTKACPFGLPTPVTRS